MLEALSHPFFQNSLLAGLLVSVACGIVGSFVVVKRISSVSGSVSHAAFGGVGLGYLLGFEPMLGAAGFALFSSFVVGFAYRKVKGNLDTLLAMVWSIGMALGMLFIAMTPGYAPDLMSFLFGSILFVPGSFLWFVVIWDVLVVLVASVLFEPLRAISFDEEFAEVLGLPVSAIFQILLAMIALTVVMLIKVVGVILVIALLTFPAAVARHWAESLGKMMVLSTILSAAFTVLGLFGSYWIAKAGSWQVPTGPLIIVIAAVVYGLSAVLLRAKLR